MLEQARSGSDLADHPGGVSAPVLLLENVTKTFPGTVALNGVSLEIREGEIHALVGQNGSGKSTLIKILAGYHRADPGSRGWVAGNRCDLTTEGAERHERLRFVHQDLGQFLELSAVDNLAIRGEFVTGRGGRVKWGKQRDMTYELLSAFDVDLDLDAPLGDATPVQRTIVAIASALAGWEGGSGVLVLDEPTAVLPHTDVNRLLDIVEQVRARGTSILYVSHRLDEIFRIADRVTVLRGGQVVETREVTGLTTQKLAETMVATAVNADYRAEAASIENREVVLELTGFAGRYLRGVDLQLHHGEIVGIAGLPGSGREELPYVLVGASPGRGEVVTPDGVRVPVAKAGRLGISILPADRGREAIFAPMSVAENLSIAAIDRTRRRGHLDASAERRLVHRWMSTVEVKAASPDVVITTLSGGNQQKVILARCLSLEPDVLVLCEPTAGVDIGTRQAIYELIAERARAGLTVLVSSTDTGDLIAMCTRVVVMCNGSVIRELHGPQITEPALLQAMEGTEQI